MQATLQLPSAKSFYGHSDFINFYCAFGDFEAGISTNSDPLDNPNAKWHWFVNGAEKNNTSPWIYNDGDTIHIKLVLNDTTKKMEFYVNHQLVWTSSKTYSLSNSNARFVVGCAQQSTGITSPLKEWNLTHNQVTIFDLMYKSTSDSQWKNMSSLNGYTDYFHCPSGVQPYPTPVDYTFTEIGNPIYASIKI